MQPQSLLHTDGNLSKAAQDMVFRLTGETVTDVNDAVVVLCERRMDKPRKRLNDQEKEVLGQRAGELLPMFEELGLTQDVLASGEAAYTILFAARFTSIVKRIAVLCRAVEAGFRPGHICLLAGTRPLQPDEIIAVRRLPECIHHPFHTRWGDHPLEHEGQLIEGIWRRVVLFPSALRRASWGTLIEDNPKATTDSLLHEWLQYKCVPCRVVGVTGPGRSYQARALREKLAKHGWHDTDVIAYQGGSDILSALEAFYMELKAQQLPLVLP